jgi:hypothetical protein
LADARTRQREYRRRCKAGRLVLRIDVADVCWAQKLIALGRLRPSQEDDAAAIAEATTQLLDDLDISVMS